MSEDQAFLAGGGEMGERIRTFDWAATPLGSPSTWPTALRSAVSIMLGSSFPTAIYWGPELRLLYNDAWAPIPAERHPDALGRPGKEVWPDIWHVVGPQFEEVFRTGKGVSTFDQMLPMVRNGLAEETYWNYSLSAIRNDDGSIAGVFNQGHETSARVLAERRLRELNESLEEQVAARTGERNELWGLSRDIMLRCGFDGKILTVNPAWTELLGWREDELIGSSLFEFIHPDDLEHTRTAAASHKDGGSYSSFENRYRHRDGSYRWISWSTRPTNEVITAVGRDITAEKEAAEALTRTEDALRQSQKMEAVGQLTGGIAHDFNNLLQGVAGSLDLIRRNPGDPVRVHRWAEAGLHAAERGAKLTGQLLAFSRAQKIEARPLRVTALIAGMRELLDRTLGPEIRIAMDLDEDCPPVLSDATQLEMSVLNLAINSRDAMPSGGRLTIGVHRRKVRGDPELSNGDYVEIAVTDTGIGMPPDVLARAFDPFFTTKGVGRGTGLGLSQVYGIARQVGGTTRIRTGEGTGTTVSIFLPVTDQPIEKASNNERELVRAPRSATVLVVDDDEDVRTFLAESLESLGFTVETAKGGEEALASLERLQPSLMILDFAMPDMNGAQVLRSVRSSHPDLPVILASGFSDTTAVEHAGGQKSYVLHKPFRVDDLSMAVDTALRERVNA